jgi:hypothetical protein
LMDDHIYRQSDKSIVDRTLELRYEYRLETISFRAFSEKNTSRCVAVAVLVHGSP